MVEVLILVALAIMAAGLLAIVMGGFHPLHIYSRRAGVGVVVAGFALFYVAGLTMQAHPSGGDRTPSATATAEFAVVAHDYPVDAVVRFESICTQDGNPLSTCVCLMHGMENRYTYARFQELVAADNPKAPEYAVVAQGCVGQ